MLTSLTERLLAATVQLAGRERRRLVFIGAVALMLGAAPLVDAGSVAHGQKGGYGQDRMEQRAPSGQGSADLPAWAEPSTGGPSNRGRASDRQQPSVEEEMRRKFNPPEPVPLGGLEWLLLAGAGYGLFKLRGNG